MPTELEFSPDQLDRGSDDKGKLPVFRPPIPLDGSILVAFEMLTFSLCDVLHGQVKGGLHWPHLTISQRQWLNGRQEMALRIGAFLWWTHRYFCSRWPPMARTRLQIVSIWRSYYCSWLLAPCRHSFKTMFQSLGAVDATTWKREAFDHRFCLWLFQDAALQDRVTAEVLSFATDSFCPWHFWPRTAGTPIDRSMQIPEFQTKLLSTS